MCCLWFVTNMAETKVAGSVDCDGGVQSLERLTDNSLPETGLNVSSAPDGGWGWFVVLGSFLFSVISDGCAFSFGVFYTELLHVFGEGKSKTSWVGSLFIGMPLVCGPVASVLVTIFGCRKMTIFGGIVSASGFILSYFATSIDMLCVTFGIVAGIGLSFCYVTSVVIVAFYFEKKRALATGLAVCGSGIGTFIFAPLTEFLIGTYGWRGSVLILGGFLLNIVVCGALYRPLKCSRAEPNRQILKQFDTPSQGNERESLHSKNDSRRRSEDDCKDNQIKMEQISRSQVQLPTYVYADENYETEKHNIAKALLTNHIGSKPPRPVLPLSNSLYYSCPEFRFGSASLVTRNHAESLKAMPSQNVSGIVKHIYKLKQEIKAIFDVNVLRDRCFLIFALSNFVLYFWYDVPYIFMVDRAQELGVTEEKASLIISVIGIVNTIGQILYGYIGDKNVNLTVLYSVSCIVAGTSVMLVPLYNAYWYMCLLSGIFGFFISANFSLSSVILVQYLGLDKLTNAWGFTMLLQGAGSLIGPPVAGWTYDKTKSYDATFYSAGVWIAVSGLILIPTICFKTSPKYQYSAVVAVPVTDSVSVHVNKFDLIDHKIESLDTT